MSLPVFFAVWLMLDGLDALEGMRAATLGRATQRLQQEIIRKRDALRQRVGWWLSVVR